jgi:hypothetical protein
MIDQKTMRSLLANLERAAEESLQQDAAFYETLQALKSEVDRDPQVQSVVSELRASGRGAFSSFVPHIKIRIKTEEGIFSLSGPVETPAVPAVEPVDRLTQELRNAASAVIMKSRYRRELEVIVNEAIGASDRFEGMASRIERAGHEVVICLDLSAYAQARESAAPLLPFETAGRSVSSEKPLNTLFSDHDVKFLKAVGVRTDES